MDDSDGLFRTGARKWGQAPLATLTAICSSICAEPVPTSGAKSSLHLKPEWQAIQQSQPYQTLDSHAERSTHPRLYFFSHAQNSA